jgi:hypothetical protein
MGDEPTPPRIETDWRVQVRFFAFLAVMFVFSGGFVLLTLASPRSSGMSGITRG